MQKHFKMCLVWKCSYFTLFLLSVGQCSILVEYCACAVKWGYFERVGNFERKQSKDKTVKIFDCYVQLWNCSHSWVCVLCQTPNFQSGKPSGKNSERRWGSVCLMLISDLCFLWVWVGVTCLPGDWQMWMMMRMRRMMTLMLRKVLMRSLLTTRTTHATLTGPAHETLTDCCEAKTCGGQSAVYEVEPCFPRLFLSSVFDLTNGE